MNPASKPMKPVLGKPAALPVKNATQFGTAAEGMKNALQRRNVINRMERAFKPHWR